MAAGPGAAPAVASARYRLYTLSQAVSVAGTMMSLTALYSYLGVIGVLVWLAGRVQRQQAPGGAGAGRARRLRWVLDLPAGIRVAAAMALLIGAFGIQFEVTNPLMATDVFHRDSAGFGLMGTCAAVGAIAG